MDGEHRRMAQGIATGDDVSPRTTVMARHNEPIGQVIEHPGRQELLQVPRFCLFECDEIWPVGSQLLDVPRHRRIVELHVCVEKMDGRLGANGRRYGGIRQYLGSDVDHLGDAEQHRGSRHPPLLADEGCHQHEPCRKKQDLGGGIHLSEQAHLVPRHGANHHDHPQAGEDEPAHALEHHAGQPAPSDPTLLTGSAAVRGLTGVRHPWRIAGGLGHLASANAASTRLWRRTPGVRATGRRRRRGGGDRRLPLQ